MYRKTGITTWKNTKLQRTNYLEISQWLCQQLPSINPGKLLTSNWTRWVDGTPTTEVTPVTIWYIHTPDLGHQMVMIMVMNDLLPPPLCNVNRPSHSEIQLFQNLTMKIHGQGHVCGQRSRSRFTFKIQSSRLWSSSNPLVTFEAWSSMDMFAFCFVAIGPFLAEI